MLSKINFPAVAEVTDNRFSTAATMIDSIMGHEELSRKLAGWISDGHSDVNRLENKLAQTFLETCYAFRDYSRHSRVKGFERQGLNCVLITVHEQCISLSTQWEGYVYTYKEIGYSNCAMSSSPSERSIYHVGL